MIHRNPSTVAFSSHFGGVKPFQRTPVRALHLIHHIFTKHPIGKLQQVKKKPLITTDHVQFHLIDSEKNDHGITTLTAALPLIKQLTHLTYIERKSKPPTSKPTIFQIKPLKSEATLTKGGNKTKHKRAGLAKEFHLTTETTPSYLAYVLNKTCEFLLQGSRIQFTLHQKKSGPSIDFALEHHPHLRPDVILRAMPGGTTMLAHPCIAPETMSKPEQGSGLDSPVMWAFEHEASTKRAPGPVPQTPGWVKKMATWDVALKPDPSAEGKQLNKTMWKYSLAKRGAATRQRAKSAASAVHRPDGNDSDKAERPELFSRIDS